MNTMKTIEVNIKFNEGETFVSDINPVVNDPDYIEVLTTANELHFEYNGCGHIIRSRKNKKEMIAEMKKTIIFDSWFEENWLKKFSDFGISAPIVYDHEEDENYAVDDIDNFINNCKNDDEYQMYKDKLQEIAENEYAIIVIEGC